MTRVTFYQNREGQYTGFESRDHSGYAEAGEDIVCAAISALVIHTVNSIERFTSAKVSESIDEENAIVRFFLKDQKDDKAEFLLKCLAQTISDMQEEESYTDFIDVKFVEV